ncbi:hypothetical protein ACI6PS_12730 [Flavobacterium sp. PLA-1-15]|uniref:hypothetical protein n=1 Tax=Flavobacterium sp. PLA-1-15 TaxID=3380533 RepID=UPI003B807350
MRKLLLLSVFALLISCAVTGPNKNAVGTPFKTYNANNPYIYVNGYLNYETVELPFLRDGDTIRLNELRFNEVYTAMYTKQVMFDKFGNWTKEIWFEGAYSPILLWENVKLFDDETELYSVSANGVESMEEMYASVIVFDAQNKDCLTMNHAKKEEIISFFAEGIKSAKKDSPFFKAYWAAVGRNTDRNLKQ